MNVLIVGHGERPDAALVARRAADWLSARGHRVLAESADIASLGLEGVAVYDGGDLGLVLSIGGDGTMLRAVGVLAGRAVPVMGVNVGHLGYLAEVEPANLESSIDRFLSAAAVI